MRSRVLLTIGLAILGACLIAGTAGGAGESVVGAGQAGVEINLPDGQDLGEVEVLPQCSNLTDDDGDGIKDLQDPDCSGPLDNSESGTSGLPEPPAPPPAGGGDSGDGATGGDGQGGDGGPRVPGGGGGTGGGAGELNTGEPGHQLGNKPGQKPDRGDRDEVEENRKPSDKPATRTPDGVPTDANPGLTIADFGPAPIGVPNFVIDQFTIPPFLLSIYQSCGTQYGIPWQVLASINRIETAFGTNLNVSSAGALGWMQFMPATWKAYGVDANNDGRKDPYNPVDAICAAARYLKAAGYENDVRGAIFAYNHADWYVDEVLLYAKQYGGLPNVLVSSLTGLTEGARFPVAANARYADDISERRALKRSKPGKRSAGNAAEVVSSSPTRRGIDIFSREGAPVVAVNDGVITDMGKSKKLGRYIVLRDAYGNRFTYAQLGEVSDVYPVPKQHKLTASDFELVTPDDDDAPDQAASAGTNTAKAAKASDDAAEAGPQNTEDSRQRLYAFPERESNVDRANLTGQLDKLLDRKFPGYESFKAYFSGVLRFDRKTMELRPLKEGSKVTAGTVLGRIGKTGDLAPHVHFAIRPAGRGAPKIDPKPILDGWKLLEATAIYRAAGKDPFDGSSATAGQVLLMSKDQLMRRVLSDPRLEIYSCGREDIQTGQIDRRILALLAYLTERGFRLTVTSLKCGHSFYTASGNVSHHSSGNAVDIAQINGQSILGNQGPGTLAEAVVKDILQLQGTMQPSQIISLMDYFGADNTFAMGDHADHIHVGFTPLYGPGSGSVSRQFEAILKPSQWERLIDRLGEIDNPDVPTAPSKYSTPTKGHDEKAQKKRRASSAHIGE
jgi:murein DD-endopeptidase MepM/ murein hydrolase activator NlpD